MEITDSQIDNVYKAENTAIKSLDIDTESEKRYSVKRAGLEAYDKSKWIRLDPNDEDTWPDYDCYVLTHFQVDGVNNTTSIQKFDESANSFMTTDEEDYDSAITHWQPIPQFNGE